MTKGKNKGKRVKLLPLILIIALCVALIIPFLLMGGCGQKDVKVTLYITRHGETTDNVRQVMSGSGGDALLTDEGRAQAKALGESISDVVFEKAYSSELLRAAETLAIILSQNKEWKGSGKYPVENSGLNDVDLGDAEGMSVEEAVKSFGDFFGPANNQSFVPSSGGESRYSFLERFDETIMDIVNDSEVSGKNVIIVCHSSADWWLQSKFPEACGEGLLNASLTKVEYSNGAWKLLMYNGGLINDQSDVP